ncbi:hypothetical protein HYFRA_00000191 [Hymenoscyphus fraxineus]|uniref:Uncharacterized protein n=1 Tax=Hymenoscyphus fraxineus TaxID=746836 RepID=A0A9N9L145_9HELO|nr:hypothetical protein HYFRA_00000191 [Hymenoscyphus fraxineus]
MKSFISILFSALLATNVIGAPLQVRDEAVVDATLDENAVDIPTFDCCAGWIKERDATAIEAREEENALDDLVGTVSIEGSPVWLKTREAEEAVSV